MKTAYEEYLRKYYTLTLDQDERVVEIELERLRGFVDHPFKVRADSQMIELQESIKKYGILNPLILCTAGNEKHSSDQRNTISVETHDPSEDMQEKHKGDQICDAENLGTASGAEQGTVF